MPVAGGEDCSKTKGWTESEFPASILHTWFIGINQQPYQPSADCAVGQ